MIKMKLIKILNLLFIFFSSYCFSQEGGMWIPNQLNEKEMRQLGMKISTKQIFNSQKPSLKDAIAHFGRGCTSEVISPQGLLLTNHHCGYSQIQSHSTIENNLLNNGFWAKNLEEELPNKNLTATFIVDIKEVTQEIVNNLPTKVTEEKRKILIDSIIEKVSLTIPKKDYQQVMIYPFYKGNQYYAFITETYEDVRLVGTPPSSIGKFGSDTDNWVWPRHTGDFSIFRIYADKNNHPAKYSKDNIPYTPKYFLPISIKEKKEGDFSFIYGFPGKTDEYLPGSALIQTLEIENPIRISLRDASLKILDEEMRTKPEIKIKYAAKYASIANGWKKWMGESQGLKRTHALQKKNEFESLFTQRIQLKKETLSEYGNLLSLLNKIYKDNSQYKKAHTYFNEVFYVNSETFRMSYLILNLLNSTPENFVKNQKKVSDIISELYKNYDAEIDAKVSAKLLFMYSQNVEKVFQASGYENYKDNVSAQDFITQLWEKSSLTGKNGNIIQILSSNNYKEIAETLSQDPVINFMKPYYEIYRKSIVPNFIANQSKLDSLQRIYMKAQLEIFPEKKFYPDANSTLRVSYGKIDGYSPEDAVYYKPFTTLQGVIEKYIPSDYEFDVPQKLFELYKSKEYGKYEQDGNLPVNYIATNHTTGGNSGSPALDAFGNLTGLNFDRVWEGTMSDLNYDPSICRNIMVDIRYILFIIDKYAGASRLLKEMKIIQ